jgi:polyhydroxyalkanoate synthesis regulator phasin
MPDGDEIIVNSPEGDRLHFPGGTDQQTIVAAMGKLKMQKAAGSPQSQAAPQPPNPVLAGASQATGIGPTPKNSLDFSSPVALGQSMAKPITDYVQQAQTLTPQGAAEHPVQNVIGKAAGFLFGGNQGIGTEHGGIATNPITGTLLGSNPGFSIAEEMASKAPFLKWLLASKTAGAAALQQASAKAGSAPVELSARTNEIVDELVQHGKLGGKIPKVVSDLLERVGPSTKTAAEATSNPLTYNEARILQSNISSLSTEEQMALKGGQKGLMKQLANSFASDVQKAADSAGAGEEHAFGMKEYATASARNRMLVKAGKVAGIGGAGYMAEQAIRKGIEAVKR